MTKETYITFVNHNWRALDIQDGRALLLSEKIIDKRAYHDKDANVTWESCSLRSWLGGAFYDTFCAEDRARILETTLPSGVNPWYRTSGGNAVTDRIFLLSIEEAVKYLGDSGQLVTQDYRRDGVIDDRFNDARVAADETGASQRWWLRSPGDSADVAAYVRDDGCIVVDGGIYCIDSAFGVRPALQIKL